MSAFEFIPVELVPMVLSTPRCVVAMRLTCTRFEREVSRTTFRKTALPTQWKSDYWTLQLDISSVAVFKRFQSSQPHIVITDDHSGCSWDNAEYTLVCRFVDSADMRVYMNYACWGINYIEDPKNIYYLVGRYGGGKVKLKKFITEHTPQGNDSVAMAAFKKSFKVNGLSYACISGGREYIDKLKEVDKNVAIFLRSDAFCDLPV